MRLLKLDWNNTREGYQWIVTKKYLKPSWRIYLFDFVIDKDKLWYINTNNYPMFGLYSYNLQYSRSLFSRERWLRCWLGYVRTAASVLLHNYYSNLTKNSFILDFIFCQITCHPHPTYASPPYFNLINMICLKSWTS